MRIIEQLSSSLGRRDEGPNQSLAKSIVDQDNQRAVAELVELLQSHKDKAIQSDCIKVLYEIGEAKPALIADYLAIFIQTLKSKNNRLVWGAMTAIDTITDVKPHEVYDFLTEILDATDKGSVITKDHGIGILIKLSVIEPNKAAVFSLLMEQLTACPYKQLPMYAERTLPLIDAGRKGEFTDLLNARFPEMEKDSQRKRLARVFRKLDKL